MKELILHIGSTKTGSSAVQQAFYENRDALEARGLLYPNVGIAGSAHHLVAAAVHPSAWRMHQDVFAERNREVCFLDYVRQLREAAQHSSADRIFLSSEYLWGRFDPTFHAKLKPLVEGYNVRVLCYLRRQDGWLESSYVQSLKGGEGRTFIEWLLANLDRGPGFCHYNIILQQWEQLVSVDRIDVRVYESVGGEMDSIADALEALGLSGAIAIKARRFRSNPSPTPQNAEALRLINASSLPSDRKIELRRKVLQAGDKKEPNLPFHFLSANETIELLKRYTLGNAAVVERYFSGTRKQLFAQAEPSRDEWKARRVPSDESIMQGLGITEDMISEMSK